MFKKVAILTIGISSMVLAAPHDKECGDLEAKKDKIKIEKEYKDLSERLNTQKSYKVSHNNENLICMHNASTLLISCVDFRLRDETFEFMTNKLGLLNDYDEMAFPGASLGLVNDKYPHWGQSINEIIALLKKLHSIKRIIFLDHRNCGAYNLIMGDEYTKTREAETKTHQEVLRKARAHIQKDFPKLEVHTFLMGLDGVVERID